MLNSYSQLFLTRSFPLSYEAAEDNEISFQEGEQITEIIAVDDEGAWWQGKNAQGHVGLFPCEFIVLILYEMTLTDRVPVANYVEVHE